MKCLERIVPCKLRLDVQDYLYTFQFAYRQGRGTDDAVNTVVHLILKHLDKPKAYARLLFIYFSSAFNLIQPRTLLTKLKQMNVNPYTIKWYHSFLIDRVQLFKVNHTLSQTVVTNTFAPQRCVSSPILHILYTNDCTSSSTNNYIITFSDDSAILSLLHADSDISMYTSEIESFVHWCDNNHLKLNVSKTQQMFFDAKFIVADHLPVVIHSEEIAQIGQYKYLGVHLDNKLSWNVHVHCVCSKVHQRLYFLRRLRAFGVYEKILVLFYRSIIESILRYGIIVWFGNMSVQSKSQLSRLLRTAMKITGSTSPVISLQEMFEQTLRRQSVKIIYDNKHVLHNEFQLLPSGRRYRTPPCRLNRYKYSFVPLSIKQLNL